MEVETTSSGRRRIRPLKYNDFEDIKHKSVSSEAANRQNIEPTDPRHQELADTKRRRSHKRSLGIEAGTPETPMSPCEKDVKRSRSLADAQHKLTNNDEQPEVRGGKRRRIKNEPAEATPNEKRSRLNRSAERSQGSDAVTPPNRHTRGKSAVPIDVLDELPPPKRRKRIATVNVALNQDDHRDEDDDGQDMSVTSETKEIELDDSRRTNNHGTDRRPKRMALRESRLKESPAKVCDSASETPPTLEPIVRNKRGRRSNAMLAAMQATAVANAESDTPSEAADVSLWQSPSPRSMRVSGRGRTASRKGRASATGKNSAMRSPTQTAASTELSDDESQKPLTKIERRTSRRGRRPKHATSSADDMAATENPSDDEVHDKYVQGKDKGLLADIFLKNSGNSREVGKRKKTSVVNPAPRISSRLAAAASAAASPPTSMGGSGDELVPVAKKQMTLFEMLPYKQKKDATAAAVALAAAETTVPPTATTQSTDSMHSASGAKAMLNDTDRTPETAIKGGALTSAAATSSAPSTSNTVPANTTLTPSTSKHSLNERPIAPTPKLRGKRNVAQVDENPVDEYTAEADDEMEEDIKLCNKKKLIQNMSNVVVALKDINADYKLTEGTSVRTNSSSSSDIISIRSGFVSNAKDTISSSPAAFDNGNKPSPSKEASDRPVVAVATATVIDERNRDDKSMSERHSVAVAKKTKKQKIPHDELAGNEFDDPLKRRLSHSMSSDVVKAAMPSSHVQLILEDVKKTMLSVGVDQPRINDRRREDEQYARPVRRPSTPVHADDKHGEHPASKSAEPDAVVSVITDSRRSMSIDRETQRIEMTVESPTKVSADVVNATTNAPAADVVTEPIENATSVLKVNENYKSIVNTSADNATSKVAVPEHRPKVIVEKNLDDNNEASINSTDQTTAATKTDSVQASNEAGLDVKQSPTTKSSKNDVCKVSDSESETEIDGEKIKILKNPPDDLVKSLNNVDKITEKEHSETQASPVTQKTEPVPSVATSDDNAGSTVIKATGEPDPVSPVKAAHSPVKGDASKNVEEKSTASSMLVDNVTNNIETNDSGIEPTPPSTLPAKVVKSAENNATATSKVDTTFPKNDQRPDLPPVIKVDPATQIQPQQQQQQMPMIVQHQQPQTQPPHRAQKSVDRCPDARRANTKERSQHSDAMSTASRTQPKPSDTKRPSSSACSQASSHESRRDSKNETRSLPSGAGGGGSNMDPMKKLESPIKKESNRFTQCGSSTSKNVPHDLQMGGSKSASGMGSNSSGSASLSSAVSASSSTSNAKYHSRNSQEQRAAAAAAAAAAVTSVDLNKMPPQFAMNSVPNYHANYWQWEPMGYAYPTGYNLHLDAAATQKSPNKYHKDLANSVYGHMTSNLYPSANLAMQEQQQSQSQSQQYTHQQQQYQQQQLQGKHRTITLVYFIFCSL